MMTRYVTVVNSRQCLEVTNLTDRRLRIYPPWLHSAYRVTCEYRNNLIIICLSTTQLLGASEMTKSRLQTEIFTL